MYWPIREILNIMSLKFFRIYRFEINYSFLERLYFIITTHTSIKFIIFIIKKRMYSNIMIC